MDIDFNKLRRWIVFIASVVIGMFLGAVEGEAQARGNEALLRDVSEWTDDLARVRNILNQGADPNAANDSG
jgi:hypothetical protein